MLLIRHIWPDAPTGARCDLGPSKDMDIVYGISTLEIEVAHVTIARVETTDTDLVVTLADGRVISTPLWWCSRLLAASPEERAG
jgi:hypothetical protein